MILIMSYFADISIISITIFYLVIIIYYFFHRRNRLNKKITQKNINFNRENIGKYFYMRSSIFTKSEELFFRVLYNHNKSRYIINSKVRMEDIFKVSSKAGNRYKEMRNRIKSRHLDFVLTDKSGQVVAIIELDDKTHSKQSAFIGDILKNQIIEYNQIKLYRVKVGEYYIERVKNIYLDIANSQNSHSIPNIV